MARGVLSLPARLALTWPAMNLVGPLVTGQKLSPSGNKLNAVNGNVLDHVFSPGRNMASTGLLMIVSAGPTGTHDETLAG